MFKNNLNFKKSLSSQFSLIKRPISFKENPRDPKLLWLDKNENLSNIIFNFLKKKIQKVDPKFLFSYPNFKKLYILLSEYLKVTPDNILLTHGSDGAIKIVYDAFLKSGDKVLRLNPTFAMYSVYPQMYDCKDIKLEYKNKNDEPYVDIKELIKLIKKYKPKILSLANPDSPTGQIINSKDLELIFKQSLESNTIVLLDEAYFMFYKNTKVSRIKKFPNLIITRSFSKAFAIAGLRVGCVISNKEIIKYLNGFKPMYEIGFYSSYILQNLLTKQGLKIVKKNTKELLNSKKYFIKELTKMNFKVINSEGNFVHVNFGLYKNKIISRLKKIVIFRENETHNSLKNFTRFTITSKKNFDLILREVKKIVRKN